MQTRISKDRKLQVLWRFDLRRGRAVARTNRMWLQFLHSFAPGPQRGFDYIFSYLLCRMDLCEDRPSCPCCQVPENASRTTDLRSPQQLSNSSRSYRHNTGKQFPWLRHPPGPLPPVCTPVPLCSAQPLRAWVETMGRDSGSDRHKSNYTETVYQDQEASHRHLSQGGERKL